MILPCLSFQFPISVDEGCRSAEFIVVGRICQAREAPSEPKRPALSEPVLEALKKLAPGEITLANRPDPFAEFRTMDAKVEVFQTLKGYAPGSYIEFQYRTGYNPDIPARAEGVWFFQWTQERRVYEGRFLPMTSLTAVSSTLAKMSSP